MTLRFSFYILLLMAVLALVSCGASDTGEAPPQSGPTTEIIAENAASAAETPGKTETNTEASTALPAAGELSDEFSALPEPYRSASYSRGRRTFKLCQACHTLKADGPNLVGPNLYGIFGNPAAAVDGFKYSDALSQSDIVWTPELLAGWLENPNTFLPGNIMSFNGVRREKDRIAVIAYIMAETGYAETPSPR